MVPPQVLSPPKPLLKNMVSILEKNKDFPVSSLSFFYLVHRLHTWSRAVQSKCSRVR